MDSQSCARCGELNPADVHTCTPDYHINKNKLHQMKMENEQIRAKFEAEFFNAYELAASNARDGSYYKYMVANQAWQWFEIGYRSALDAIRESAFSADVPKK